MSIKTSNTDFKTRIRQQIEDPIMRKAVANAGNDSNLLIVFYVQIMPDDLVMQLHRF